jgi:1-acyl-sn-glycerol-3-phosphate acyltransferase
VAKREKSDFWIRLGAVLFYPISALGKHSEKGTEHIPAEGGVIFAMNHVSHLDPPIDGVFVHRNKRVPRFMAKDSLFKVFFFGKLLGGSGGIPVYRGTGDAKDSLRDAITALKEGKLVVIYPEGTITRDPDGWPMWPRTGVARLALEAGVPVIPAARWGTQDILNGYTKKFRPFPRKKIYTTVGEPMDLAEYRDQEVTTKLLREVTNDVMARVRDLLAEVRDEQAPEEFYKPRASHTKPETAG